ncbi:MAG: hypothetical protein Q8K98_06040 [Bacteroidota bacterium]|nr:hypothetical protein [Bacteroidota bacterium]
MEFIEDLLNSPTFFPAYAPELLPQLSKSIIETDFTGTNLNCLERCVKILASIENNFPNLARSDGSSERGLVVLSAQRTSDVVFKQAQQHLKEESDKIQSWIKSKNVEELEGYSHKKFDVGSVWMPMVEREQFLTAVEPLFASLQKLNIDAAFSNKDTGFDKLHIKQLSHKEESGESDLLNTAEAARYLLGKFAHIKGGKRVAINCSFNNPTFVEGQSLQAGLAAGLFTELLRLHQHKEEYALRDDVAITGRIDKHANLLPVDEGGLKLKVEACYFSHIKYLIVPKDQAGICKDVIGKLIWAQEQSSTLPPKNGGIAQTEGNADQTKQAVILSDPEFNEGESKDGHRSRNLEVVGISNLEELFYNRRLTDSRRISIAKQTVRKVWKLRRPIAAMVIVTLLLVIGKMLYGPIDKNPVTYTADGETLFLKNMYGEIVDKIFIGNFTVENINNNIRDGLSNKIVSLIDINRDKINEVIYTQAYRDTRNNIVQIFCKDIIKDSILWSVNVERKLKFPYHPYVNSYLFHVGNISAGDYDNDGRPEIYINACHFSYFPGLLMKLDALSGEKLAEYINIGQFQPMEFADIDSDGVSEVILAGVNNSYDMAAVAILDTRFIEGHSPISKNYDIEEFKPGLEKAYLLIPRTIVGNYFRNEYRHNNTQNIDIKNSEKMIVIGIADCPLPSNNKKRAAYFVQLNFDLSVKDIGTGNVYDILARQLYAEGKITRPVDYKYFDEYKKEILYWDGDKFVKYPTLNKRYLEAVAELEKGKVSK